MDFGNKNSVDKLLKACVSGNEKYQKLLYETFYSKMLFACNRYCDSIDEAKDVLHDGFIKVFLNLERFDNQGSLEGWIRRIIVNTAIDYTRKKKLNTVEFEDVPNEMNFLEKQEEEREFDLKKLKAEIVVKLIDELSPAYKTVFNLYIIENYSHKEIADMLGVTVGTSKSNLAKAKNNLKKLFEKYVKEQKIVEFVH